jgi:hypothetical protein
VQGSITIFLEALLKEKASGLNLLNIALIFLFLSLYYNALVFPAVSSKS